MAVPTVYYNSLPPMAKTNATIFLATTGAYHLGLWNPGTIALFYKYVFQRFQIWRLITNFFFLGPFSLPFAFHLLIILRYVVSFERSPFDKRTVYYIWMFFFAALLLQAMAVVSFLWSPFIGASLVFMIIYIWSREFPNTRIVKLQGLVELKVFYLPWAMFALDLVFGNPLMPDLLGIGVGHLYYFLIVLHPLAGGNNFCKTPLWFHKLVKYWGRGYQMNSPIERDMSSRAVYRVGKTTKL